MLKFTFWKVFLKGRVFTFMGVLLVAVAVVMAVVIMAVAVAGVAVIKAVVVMALGKGFGENPEKSSLRRKEGFPLGFLMQKGV